MMIREIITQQMDIYKNWYFRKDLELSPFQHLL